MLCLIYRTHHERSIVVGNTVLLDVSRSEDITDHWDLYALGCDANVIRCTPHIISEIADGQDSDGNPTTFFDGMPYSADLARDVIEAAENHLQIVSDCFPNQEKLPLFLSTQIDLKPCRHEVILTASISNLFDLPDIQARIAEIRQLEKLQNDPLFNLSDCHYSSQFSGIARSMGLMSDLRLPIEIADGQSNISGVLWIGQPLEDHLFSATLFLSSYFPISTSAVVLRRKASIVNYQERLTFDSIIGTVVGRPGQEL